LRFKDLFFRNRADGAAVLASAAIYALRCIDNVFAVAFGNSAYGANVGTGTAFDTLVTDNSGHNNLSLL
jgi:hypothetical protein